MSKPGHFQTIPATQETLYISFTCLPSKHGYNFMTIKSPTFYKDMTTFSLEHYDHPSHVTSHVATGSTSTLSDH